MKNFLKSALVVGLIFVLTPCACDEFSRLFGTSCHTAERGCCGGSDLDIHSFMDQKAVPGTAVQIPPVALVLATDLAMFPTTMATGSILETRSSCKSPSAYSPPLRI